MALVRKKLAVPGDFQATHADGKRQSGTKITDQRIRRWVTEGRRMLDLGITIPAVWGHQLSALPIDPSVTDPEAYKLAKANAGVVCGFERDPADGGLYCTIDAPGLTEEDGYLTAIAEVDGAPVKTAIKSVSPAIGGVWKDGQGREWRDIIGHVALAPKPVWDNQPGFVALATGQGTGFVYLGADEPDQFSKNKAREDDDGKGDEDGDGDEDLADEMVEAAGEDDGTAEGAPRTGDEPGGKPDTMSRLLANMAQVGVALPPDTDDSNFIERLDVAVTALLANKQLADQHAAGQQNGQQNKQPPREERPPVMTMSTLSPREQNLVRREAKRLTDERLKRIEAFEGRGLPIAEGNRLRARVAGVKLALDADGNIRRAQVDDILDVLDRTLPAADDPRLHLATGKVRTAPSPADKTDKDEKTVVHEASGLEMPESQYKRIREQAKR